MSNGWILAQDHSTNRRFSEGVNPDCVNGSAKRNFGNHSGELWRGTGESCADKIAGLKPCRNGFKGRTGKVAELKPEGNRTPRRPTGCDTGLEPHWGRKVQRVLIERKLHDTLLAAIFDHQRQCSRTFAWASRLKGEHRSNGGKHPSQGISFEPVGDVSATRAAGFEQSPRTIQAVRNRVLSR